MDESLRIKGRLTASFELSAAARAVPPPDPAELARLTGQAEEYIRAAKAQATLGAYRADWRHFENWCREKGFSALPATPDTVALYLGEIAATHRPSTLARRLTSINKVHRAAGHPRRRGWSISASARRSRASAGFMAPNKSANVPSSPTISARSWTRFH